MQVSPTTCCRALECPTEGHEVCHRQVSFLPKGKGSLYLFLSSTKPRLTITFSLSSLISRHSFGGENKSVLDLHSLKRSAVFKQYLALCVELQHLNLSLLDENQRKSLCLNIYNFMIVHAIIAISEDAFARDQGKCRYIAISLKR